MEPQIRFCTSADGTRIAYATAGEGPLLFYVNGWPGHLGVEWESQCGRTRSGGSGRLLEGLGPQ